MPERYPTTEEFWRRVEVRGLEPDLRYALRARAERVDGSFTRLGGERAATAVSVAARLLPGSAVPAEVLAGFLDASLDRQLGRGDEQHGVLPTPELIPAGLDAVEEAARKQHGSSFAELPGDDQDSLLSMAEKGELEGPDGFDSSAWFKRIRGKLLLAYGSDPRAMVQMGFPGPSYKSGHIWLDRGEIPARANRKRGYLRL